MRFCVRANMWVAQSFLLLLATASVLVVASEQRWSVEGIVRGGGDDVQVLLQGDDGQYGASEHTNTHLPRWRTSIDKRGAFIL